MLSSDLFVSIYRRHGRLFFAYFFSSFFLCYRLLSSAIVCYRLQSSAIVCYRLLSGLCLLIHRLPVIGRATGRQLANQSVGLPFECRCRSVMDECDSSATTAAVHHRPLIYRFRFVSHRFRLAPVRIYGRRIHRDRFQFVTVDTATSNRQRI